MSKSSKLTRVVCMLLAVLMLVGVLPVNVFAGRVVVSGGGNDQIIDDQQSDTDNKVTADLTEITEKMDAILVKYLGKTGLTPEETEKVVSAMDYDTLQAARLENYALEEEAKNLCDADIAALLAYSAAYVDFASAIVSRAESRGLARTSVNVLDGKITLSDSANTGKFSSNKYTATAKGSLLSKKTNDITITNNSGVKSKLTFDYLADKASSFKIAGASAAASGTYSVILEAGATLKISITSNSGFSNLTATLTLSNFSLVAIKDNSNVTFDFDSELGSVTAGGTAVNDGDTKSVSGTNGVALAASAINGAKFLGWVEADGTILSTAATYTLIPAEDMTIRAAFAKDGGKAWFAVGATSTKTQSAGLLGLGSITYYAAGTSCLFDDFNTAATYAAANTTKAMVLMNSATLAAGEYTIPAGVTLLIPFDDANTLYTTGTQFAAYTSPTAYRTLSMANGAKLTVNGSLSLSAKHTTAQGSKANGGSPTGAVSFIRMEEGSNITVNNGGSLYAYGFITGSGSVVANSGATVYENFQIMDFRGGTQSTDMENGVFPISQYYLQNIEVPLTLYSGAKEYALTTVTMSGSDFQSSVAFISNSGAMFNLTSGYVVKDYDETKDRLIIRAYGNVNVASINMTVGTSSINSKDYELPINSNMTVEAVSGNITMGQDLAFLPGSQIIVGENAKCTLSNGINVYVYDADQWGNYAGATNKKFIPVTYAPGRDYTRTEADLVDAKVVVNGTVDASNGYIYVTEGGADISGNGTVSVKHGTQAVTYQLVQGTGYNEIKLIPALPGDENWEWTISHNGNPVVAKEATCTESGLETTTCTCGYVKEVVIPVLDHTEIIDEAVAPTCTETGLTEGKHCSVCNTVLIAQDVVAETGHTEGPVEIETESNATCTTVGIYYEVVKCTVCGVEISRDKKTEEVIPHNYETVVTAPTCTDKGYTTYTCTACGDKYTDNETEALGHKYNAVVTNPTCTDKGYTTHTCSVCNDSYVDGETEALGHNYNAVVTEPTCTDKGYTTHTCSVCNDTYVDGETEALGHTEVTDAAVAPNCENTGLTAGSHCSVCNTVIVAQTVVSATGHAYTSEITTAPTCTVTGIRTYTCSNVLCPTPVYTEVEPALGHDMVRYDEIPATCTEPGSQAGSHCSRCDYTEEMGEIPALGHDMVTDAAVAPTCTDTGLTEGSHCSRCDGATTEQEVVEALGHDMVTDEAVAPTCTETGLTEGSHCSRCDGATTAQKVVDALGHNEVVDKAVAPDCVNTGLTEGSHCDRCGVVLDAQEEVPALGHDMVTDKAVAPDCVNTGLTEGSHCSRCDGATTPQEEVPALGHIEVVDAAVAPTCLDTGLTAGSHCSRCNEVLVERQSVDALGHNTVVDEAVAPTCTAAGKTEGSHCGRCGVTLVAQKGVSALGHNMADATCTEPKTCTRCNYTQGVALGHTEVYYEEEPAFCNQEGYTEGYICSVCNAVTSGREVIPALDHDIITIEAKQPTYSSVGWDTYEKCTRCAYSTYVEIPKLPEPKITTFEELLENLILLEELANEYVTENPGKDPADLVIKYIRTGVEKYTTGSWGIMAGYEDKAFAAYVANREDELNRIAPSTDEMLKITGLKNLREFKIPNGDYYDMEHLFGSMDITYNNKGSQNHADVSGWAGDLVDLIAMTDKQGGFPAGSTFEEKVQFVRDNRLGWDVGDISGFGIQDIKSDLDVICIMDRFYAANYEVGTLTQIFTEYFTADLDDVARADYFLKNRLGGVSNRIDVREAVLNTYIKNNVVTTLESTEDIKTKDVTTLRKACAYAFADHLCQLAGDYVENMENDYYSVFSSETSTLAPGITQKINYATSADGKQMVYYLATGDITRDDVHFRVNYNDTYPEHGWAMARVLDQANAAQERYGNPESPDYIENYNVIASTNGAGFNMQTGEPGGLMVMNGVQWQDCNASGFFGILKDGTPIIGTKADYDRLKDQVQEGISIFGSTLIKDGEICINRSESYYSSRASRTAIGITKTGKIVMMVLDGRQEPFSCGGSMEEIAQILYDAGCVEAVNLDGGGSTTFVAKQPGDEELSVVNRPSDGVQRSVSTSIMLVSTAPSSTAFDHADIEAENEYLTVGSSTKLTAHGISATGNAAELPEGAELVVEDTTVGSITDGVFTAKTIGDVNVSLVHEGIVLGTTTLHVVYPDNVYFKQSSVTAVYGQTMDLPVQLTYQGKNIIFNENDVVITLSKPSAGTVSGISFTGKEGTGIKTLQVTAALAADGDVTATSTINLFNQGEVSFDFDQATGGDRILAWDRKVTNAVTTDQRLYTAIDASEDMVTSYIFALDMREIPIPGQLADLTSMLPGYDMEGASAWTFFMQLAERISVLTTVTAEIQVDPNFDVDYSGLTIVNEYFDLEAVEYDEATNKLRITVRWKDQTAAIPADTANPIFIVSGVKLTPKDGAAWDENEKLAITNSGNISYKIYMRANALYSFASKPENQAIYGLQAFINPNDPSEKGGWFTDTYATFEDSFTLSKLVKNGWVLENGGYAYYIDGVKLTGIQQVEGLYYDFGTDGVSFGTYTGFYTDDKGVRYIVNGAFTTGWKQIFEDFYYFGSDNYAVTGVKTISGHKYTFDENGVLVEGSWETAADGRKKYYWAGAAVKRTFFTINGDTYYFDYHAYMLTGLNRIETGSNTDAEFYLLDENGILRNTDGIHHANGEVYYVQNGHPISAGLVYEDGYYYYIRSSLLGCRNGTYNIYTTNGYMPRGNYTFDDMGRMILEPDSAENILNRTGIYLENGYLYYYIHNAKQVGLGLINYNGYYYYVRSGGELAVGDYYVTTTNGLMDQGTYTFDDHGRMLIDGVPYKNGVVKEDGSLYLYINCEKQIDKGLVEFEDAYYYVKEDGTLAVGDYEVTKTNGLFEAGVYTFEDSGKMHIVKNGIYREGSYLYYYVNDVKQKDLGLINIDGDFYFVKANGTLATGKTYVNKPNGLVVKNDEYEFGEDGKMYVIEYGDNFMITRAHGYIYYYVNGVRQDALGLIKVNGSYFYVRSGGELATGICNVYTTNGLVERGNYEFDKDGRMIIKAEEPKNGIYLESGYYYYYINDVMQKDLGIIEIDGATYYILANGRFATGVVAVTKTNGIIEAGKYEFAADGKLVGPVAVRNGIVNENGKLYCYINDVMQKDLGIIDYNGAKYYVKADGTLAVGIAEVTKTNGLVEAGKYEFAADGKLVGPVVAKNGIYKEGGSLYYYVNDVKQKDLGLINIDGDFYFVKSNGTLATGKTYVNKPNGLVVKNDEYEFGADGKMYVIEYGDNFMITRARGYVYYYVNGVRQDGLGLIEVNGSYFYVRSGGELATGVCNVYTTNGLVERGNYEFDKDGRMIVDIEEPKNGIYFEDGFYYYYIDDTKQLDLGITEIEGATYYILANGAFATGVVDVTKTNGIIEAGKYEFAADGKLVGKIIVKNGIYLEDGSYYYYINDKKQLDLGITEIEDATYYILADGKFATGIVEVTKTNGLVEAGKYEFAADGKLIGKYVPKNGIYEEDGKYYYYIDDEKQLDKGIIVIDGATYYILANGAFAVGVAEVTKTNGIIEAGKYEFATDGKLIGVCVAKNGIYKEGGNLYYYVNDVKQTNLGLIKIGDDYYYVKSNGTLATGKAYVTKANGLVLQNDEYEFGEDGKMYVVDSGDNYLITRAHGYLYYFVNGVKQTGLGLIKIGGYYYYVRSTGELATGIYYVTNGNGLKPSATYEFGTDGRMLVEFKEGIYFEDGYYYYYVDDVKQLDLGITEIEDATYYILADGKFAVGTVEVTKTNGLVEAGKYLFAEDGKLVKLLKNGIFFEDGKYFYYIDDEKQIDLGIIELDGETYYVLADGAFAVGIVEVTKTNNLVEEGRYLFAEDGKLVKLLKNGIFFEDGNYYYYIDDEKQIDLGLTKIADDLYYVLADGAFAVGIVEVTKTNGLVEAGRYLFAEDGKLVKLLKNGIFFEDGNYYYYIDDEKQLDLGIIELDGATYYVLADGAFAVGIVEVTKTNGLVEAGRYLFAEDGKLVKLLKNGIFFEDGNYYYYIDDEKQLDKGITVIDGATYYILADGAFATGIVEVTKTNGLVEEGRYLFAEDGKLVKFLKNGIYLEDGKYYYYIDDEKQLDLGIIELDGATYYVLADGAFATGIHYVTDKTNGIIEAGKYEFAADGKLMGQLEIKNGIYEEDGNLHYYVDDVKQKDLGLIDIDGNYYYVKTNGDLAVGKSYVAKTNGIVEEGEYEFAADGKLVTLVRGEDYMILRCNGYIYYYVNSVKQLGLGLVEVNGDYYYVRSTGDLATGIYYVWNTNGLAEQGTYEFAADGKLVRFIKNGIFFEEGKYFYYIDDVKQLDLGLTKIADDLYCILADGAFATGIVEVTKTNDLVEAGRYLFAEDGKLLKFLKNGIYEEDGKYFYYIDDEKQLDLGIIELDGATYYVLADGAFAVGIVEVTKTNGLVEAGRYLFAEDGKLVKLLKNGIFFEDGNYYYYIDDVKQLDLGLTKIADDLYYILADGAFATGIVEVIKTNDLVEEGRYLFAEDGKLVKFLKNGIYEEDGKYYYYIDDEKQLDLGIIELDGATYYVLADGAFATGIHYVTDKTNGIIEAGKYEFAADGKLIGQLEIKNGIYEEDGNLHYYVDDVKQKDLGLITINGDYYYVKTNGDLAVGKSYVAKTNGIVEEGEYEFAADGKLVTLVRGEDYMILRCNGYIYYYVNSVKQQNLGLVEVNGDYYYVRSTGELATGIYYVWNTNGLAEQGTYEFAADGKLVRFIKNGIFFEEGNYYYYIDDEKQLDLGITVIDGATYYILADGAFATGIVEVTKTNDLVEEGRYLFAEDGKLVKLLKNGIYEEDGKYFYYIDDEKQLDLGITVIDGATYYILADGAFAVGIVEVTKTNDLVEAGRYLFAEDGKLVKLLKNGIFFEDGNYYYYIDDEKQLDNGITVIDGATYYILADGAFATGIVEVTKTNDLVEAGKYLFAEDGKLVKFLKNGIYEEDGKYYYYIDDEKQLDLGITVIDGATYYVLADGAFATGIHYVTDKTNGIIEAGKYEFAADGKLMGQLEIRNGIYNDDGDLYYYVDDQIQKNLGLIDIDGDYYNVGRDGKLSVGNKYVVNTNGIVEEGEYIFAEDGKLVTLVRGEDYMILRCNGYIYYYVNSVKQLGLGLVKVNEAYYYVRSTGELAVGMYYVWTTNGLAEQGVYEFAEDGKLLKLLKNGIYFEEGNYYYYVNDVKQLDLGIIELDGATYYVLADGAFAVGIVDVTKTNDLVEEGRYLFNEDGKLIKKLKHGVYNENGALCLYIDGEKQIDSGLVRFNGDYYYVKADGTLQVGTALIKKTNGIVVKGEYIFGADGKLFTVENCEDYLITKANGYLYYYINGEKQIGLGLIYLNGNYYYVRSGGELAVGTYYVWTNNNLMPSANYDFDLNGRLITDIDENKTGVYREDDGLYYYIAGVRQIDLGIIEHENEIYYVQADGKLATGTVEVTKTNGIIDAGEYEFTSSGKLIKEPHYEFVWANGYLHLYIDGDKQTDNGLIKVEGNYYYIKKNGTLAVNGTCYVTKTNGIVEIGDYEFDADGRMYVAAEGDDYIIVKCNGYLYYYLNGEKQTGLGLIEVDGSYYYYIRSTGELATGTYYVWTTNGLVERGMYEFAEDGKMIVDSVEKNGIYSESGYLYYYVNDVKQKDLGLINIDGDFYFVKSNGTLATGKTYVNKPNGLVVKNDEYEFGEDGKMYVIEYGDNFMITRAHGYVYYYVNGVRQDGLGLIEVNGSYFYVKSGGELATGVCNVYTTNGIVERGNYEFDEDGRMIIA